VVLHFLKWPLHHSYIYGAVLFFI